MAMEGIPSRAIVTKPTMMSSPPPKHTIPGHEQCAYYLRHDDYEAQDLMCPHGLIADGAFYSEDYIRELRELSHRLISHFEILDNNKSEPKTGQFEQYEPYYEFQSLGVVHWNEEIMGEDGLIGRLRELTR